MNDVTTLTQQVLLAFFIIAVAVGVISQRTHFCTMGAIADVVNMGDWTRARQWMLAIGVAMIGFAALVQLDLIDASKTLYANNRFMWLSSAVGGLMFGYGMVMASGCGNKTLVRIGAGNLKSLVVFLVLGLSAFATLKGITAVVRVNTVDAVALSMPNGADLGALIAAVTGHTSKLTAIWSGYALGTVLVLWVLRHADFWTVENLLASVGIGALIVAMWWVSGHFGFLPEHPETLEPVYLGTNSGRIEAMSFVAPLAHSLDWLMFFSDKSKVLTVGVMSVVGVVVGSAASALQQKTFRWEGFANVEDLSQHLLGGVLMGVGGVTAMGCTFGQGLSGISTLSLNSFVAVAAIVTGAVLSIRHQVARLERSLA
ncbi:transporter [Limnohabitans sp. JirII-29]|uniref:YeeE/YedE family protein n=1 Tax=unclassified Limnohabitans TaxID=2626134 RepID=UPI000C1E2027|nr:MULTISPECIES: YeeE/YedE family protein [unclassified Limnohabitans]PIT80908.1 transporter [Limnohabitans sp. JirII-31]PUE28254.1 transporter [Limnohabitans sp. JirII-29]